MRRGELYRVYEAAENDPRQYRVFVVVSRQALLDSRFSTAICAPIYSVYDGLSTQVAVGAEVGLKHNSSIHCDELVSVRKTSLTHFVGTLTDEHLGKLDSALAVALRLDAASPL